MHLAVEKRLDVAGPQAWRDLERLFGDRTLAKFGRGSACSSRCEVFETTRVLDDSYFNQT